MTHIRRLRFQAQEWTINGVVAGSGPPILLLHGIGMSWEWWQPTIAELANMFTVCAIDLPGSGGSSPLIMPPLPEQYAALVEKSIEAFSQQPSIVVGHSLGGYVATQAAILGASGIRGLFLIAPAGFGRVHNRYFRLLSLPLIAGVFRWSDRISRFGPPSIRRLGLRTILGSLVHDPKSITDDMLRWADISEDEREQFLYQIRVGIDFLGHTYTIFSPNEVQKLTIPVSLLWGQYDSVFPIDIAYRARSLLHSASLRVFDHSGHMPQHEEPGRFYNLLRAFNQRT